MNKKNWDGYAWDGKGEFDIDATIEERERVLPENLPTIPKWKARQARCRMRLNGCDHDVAACLIDCACTRSGACYPSENTSPSLPTATSGP